MLSQVFKRNKVKLSNIRQSKNREEKLCRRKYSVDTMTDIATVDFSFASSSSQSKKKTILSS